MTDLDPNYEKDGFINEQPPFMGRGYTVTLGERLVGHFNRRIEAVNALVEVATGAELLWLIRANGDMGLI